jgi:hypothetical protein
MSEVVTEIRQYPVGRDSAGDRATWGPSPDDARIASLRFPAGARMAIYRSTDVATPHAYNPGDELAIYNADVAAGGDAGAGAACSQVTSENFANFQFQPATLDQLVAGVPGTPCVYGSGATRSEWWSNSTVNIGNVPYSATDPAYRNERSIRVSFGADRAANFYSCPLAADNGSPRNCDGIGSTTYTIETMGDGRVLRFAQLPAETSSLTYTRIFVEREGKVFYGYRNKPATSVSLRLDTAGTDALFNALGVTR